MVFKALKRLHIINKLKRKSHSIVSFKCSINDNTFLEGCNKVGSVNISNTQIGFGSYILSGDAHNGSIGKYTSIGHNFQIIDATHPIDFVSTFPGFYHTENKNIFNAGTEINIVEHKYCSNGKSFIIGNDVWIGNNVTVLGGVSISDGAVIGANALVTKDVPPYAVVGGVPAKIIRFRFDGETINKLLKIQWWLWDVERIKREAHYFSNIDVFLKRNS